MGNPGPDHSPVSCPGRTIRPSHCDADWRIFWPMEYRQWRIGNGVSGGRSERTDSLDTVDVLIVGAGTTGLTLALQTQAHGARVHVIDRRVERSRPSRAMMMHPRTLEVLRPLCVTERMLARGDNSPVAELHLGHRTTEVKLDHFDLPDTPYPHLLLISQGQVEAVLWEAIDEQGINVDLGVEFVALRGEVAEPPPLSLSSTAAESPGRLASDIWSAVTVRRALCEHSQMFSGRAVNTAARSCWPMSTSAVTSLQATPTSP